MRDFYGILNKIIKEELDMRKKIVIYPIGRVGLEAKNILENRFGQKGIYVDNEISKYNGEVYNLDKIKGLDENYSVIVCSMDYKLNVILLDNVKSVNQKVFVRSCLEYLRKNCPEKETIFKKIKDACRVKRSKGFDLVRVGAINDGGYIMLDDFKENYRAYSFGIGNDVSWDDWVSNKGIQVFCYDHTIDGLPHQNSKLSFFKIGITDEDKPEDNLLSLTTLLKRNGDENNNDLILKMDVEGAEWNFINSIDEEILTQFRQMTFELHNLTDIFEFDKRYKGLLKLQKTHCPVWVHANNALGIENAISTSIPPLLEITYVRRDTYELQDTQYNSPIDIDAPNMLEFLDVELEKWGTIDK